VAEKKLSVRRACAAVLLSRAAYYRQSEKRRCDRDQPVVDALNGVVDRHRRWGFWKCYDRLRLDGHSWNHKRVWRVYREMRLNLPRRTKKRIPTRQRQTLEVPAAENAIWALDFMSDALYQGRRFRTLNILDEGVREALDIVIDTSIPSGRVVRTLEQLGSWRGLPQAIRCDNGPEIVSQAFVDWCKEQGIEIRYIQPGKPNQNAYVERFNRTYREEVLDAYLFEDLGQVREITYRWLSDYNDTRPHDSLGRIPPSVFRRNLSKLENSTSGLST
jgi:putative transposase